MKDLVDLWFHIVALWTPPALQPVVQKAHRQARQSIGHPKR